MPTMADLVVKQLSQSDAPLDDDQLAVLVRADRHHVNAVCRKLESEGTVRRSKVVGGKIVNQLVASNPDVAAVTAPSVGYGKTDKGSVSTGADLEVHTRLRCSMEWGSGFWTAMT